MKKLQKSVGKMCVDGKRPRGFNTDQCRILVDAYNELVNETRIFLKDKQVYCLLKNRFHFPGKEKGNGLYVVWRKDLISIVK